MSPKDINRTLRAAYRVQEEHQEALIIPGALVQAPFANGCSPSLGARRALALMLGKPVRLSPAAPDLFLYNVQASSTNKPGIDRLLIVRTINLSILERLVLWEEGPVSI